MFPPFYGVFFRVVPRQVSSAETDFGEVGSSEASMWPSKG